MLVTSHSRMHSTSTPVQVLMPVGNRPAACHRLHWKPWVQSPQETPLSSRSSWFGGSKRQLELCILKSRVSSGLRGAFLQPVSCVRLFLLHPVGRCMDVKAGGNRVRIWALILSYLLNVSGILQGVAVMGKPGTVCGAWWLLTQSWAAAIIANNQRHCLLFSFSFLAVKSMSAGQ